MQSTEYMTEQMRLTYFRDMLNKSIAVYNERLSGQYDENGVHLSEKYGVVVKIAQAACNYGGYIVTGTRHYCPIMTMQIDAFGDRVLLNLAGGHDNVVQGFTDQYGRFYNRTDAYKIAVAANQLLPRHEYGETLYSESYI